MVRQVIGALAGLDDKGLIGPQGIDVAVHMELPVPGQNEMQQVVPAHRGPKIVARQTGLPPGVIQHQRGIQPGFRRAEEFHKIALHSPILPSKQQNAYKLQHNHLFSN